VVLAQLPLYRMAGRGSGCAAAAWGGHLLIHGQVGEKGLNFGCSQLGGTAFDVEKDVTSDPVRIGLFGTGEMALEAQSMSSLLERSSWEHVPWLLPPPGALTDFSIRSIV
jgi:hypothetical protein